MTNAFIFHCSNGSPYIHWYQWLKRKLTAENCQVFLPQMPQGEAQTLQNWLKTVEEYKPQLENSILIGHSLGVPFIIDLLNIWNVKVKAAFLVAGFTGKLNTDHGEPNIPEFAENDFEWNKIKSSCAKFFIIHGDNDKLVPLEKAHELGKNLNTQVTLIQNGGHFQAQAGYPTFPELLNLIKPIL